GVLPWFLSIRAAIRAHVLFMKSELAAEGTAAWQEAKCYLDLAGSLAMPKPPLLVAIGGLSGTGKSVLARGLAGVIEPVPGAVVVRSDVVRKHLFDVSEATGLPEAAYRADTTQRVYDALSGTAQRALAQGCSVVLDASFMQQSQRKAASAATGLDWAAAFRSIALDCTARIAAHHSSACAGDAEAVHQIRVAITRLRAAVSFFAPMTVDSEWSRLKKEIAWLHGS